jgi:lipopolysaccharide export system protein LptC
MTVAGEVLMKMNAASLDTDAMAAYGRAQRHSGRVRFLKKAIPLSALIAVALIAFITFFDPFGRISGLTLGPLSLSGSKITMENPRLTGYRKDSRPYEVTALAAMQDVRKPNIVEMKNLNARITLSEASVAKLEAVTGIFDTQKEHLELQNNVRVRTDSGYDANLRSASIDFKAGTVISREPVRVVLSNGLIEANSLDITDNGKMIVFKGQVRATFSAPADMGAKKLDVKE